MPQFPYQFSNEYIVRAPLFSYRNFKEQVNKDEISDIELKKICRNPLFQEAIYLASPNLYEEINQWLFSEKNYSKKQYQNLKNTILKYFCRMSTRCTPFGLFSGVGLGKFTTSANKVSHTATTRDTKLDMHFLVALSKHFENIPHIKNKLLFYPNNSIYKIGSKLRYVEYEFYEGKRDYMISTVPLSEELKKVFEFSKQGKSIQQITNTLVNKEITKKEAEEFIEELIDNQILVSELEANVSGNDFLKILISVLKRLEANEEKNILLSVERKLEKLDSNIGNSISDYIEIEILLKAFDVKYEQKYLFQTDLYFQNKIEISNKWKRELKKVISFLNKISLSDKDTHLEKFKKSFSERFEEEEVPLLFALDTEIGLGYRQDIKAKGIHPYLDDLDIPIKEQNQEHHIKLNSVQYILNQKMQAYLQTNRTFIELTDEDFNDFETNWNDLPDTISFMADIISENDTEKLVLPGGGGSSAACLLGRFCSENSEVQYLTKNIIQKEEELNPDSILAEIIHLPEARIGNIIRRPTLRQYEIPYLAKSILPEDSQIPANDLYISLRNNKIILRSKKMNKEIKPYLTNAHNYYTNTLPIYHFLSDLHSENKRSRLYFNWGDLQHIYNFLPRVEYQNNILSKAQWKINSGEIEHFFSFIDNKLEFINAIENWRNERKIPVWIELVESDNKLVLNLLNYDMAKLFFQTIKSKKTIVIEETLYNKNNDFINQFIFLMHKNSKEKTK